MTFLNPFVLFGLAAASIPLILHLLSLRKLRTIEFSTLTFLKELQQSRLRRLKLRQILLLILRTLLVIFIVLAFARPALRGTILGTIGSHAHSTVAIIFDDSFSMTASDENGERFKQAKEKALNLLNVLKDGDEAYLVKLSDLPKPTTDPAMHDFHALRTLISESSVSGVRRPLGDALRLTARLLGQSRNANKEVYIISDMQRTLFYPQTHEVRPERFSLFDDGVKFFVVPVGSSAVPNVGIDSVAVTSTILEKGKPVSVHATVRNYGPQPIHDYVISAYLDSAKAAQGSVSADANGSATVDLTVIPRRSGLIAGYLELEHDAMEEDDRRYFALSVPAQIPVALVSTTPQDLQFPLLALRSEEGAENQSLLKITQTTPQKLPLLELKSLDAIMCASMDAFSAQDIDRIRQYVERGGGLVLFPEPNFLPRQASALLAALQIPGVDDVMKSPDVQSRFSFEKVDRDHPLFSTIFEASGSKDPARAVESPAIVSALHRRTGKEGHAIITFGGGNPFLSEHRLGEGRILLYSVSPVLDWSDFPLKGIFAPLMYRSVLFVAAHDDETSNAIAGEEPVLSFRNRTLRSAGGQLKLTGPDGVEEVLHPSSSMTAVSGLVPPLSTQLPRMNLPGFYRVLDGTTPWKIVPVNLDHEESDTRLATSEETDGLWKNLGVPASAIRVISGSDQLEPVILQSRFGVELWKHCILIALLLALTEMLVARDNRKAASEAAMA